METVAGYPSEIAYFQPMQQLPADCQNINTVTVPSNGSTFTSGSQIYLDLPQAHFLDQLSPVIRYKGVAVFDLSGNALIGTPAVSPFSKLEIIAGGTQIETIQYYNQVYNLMANLMINNSQKLGYQSEFNYSGNASQGVYNGYELGTTATTSTLYHAFPLLSCLTNADKYIPLALTGPIRIILTVAPFADIATGTGSYTISNLELSYNLIQFSNSITQEIMNESLRKSLKIKTMTYLSTSTNITAASSGTQDYIFNTKASSCKALFFLATGTAATSKNKIYDSFDVSRGGQYSVFVGQKQYPIRPLDVGSNKGGILAELRKASATIGGMFSNIFDKANDMSISTAEFSYAEDGTTTAILPSKFIIGVSTEVIHKNNVLYSGISTQNTPLSLRVSFASPTVNSHNLNCILCADAVLMIDQGFVSLKI